MTLRTSLAAGAALSTLALFAAGGALAQSTGTTEVEELVVTGQRTGAVEGLILAEQATKSRSTITQDYLATQAPGQSLLQSINSIPGVNFTNDDPYGATGGNLRMRSFDKQRISMALDGMPLNDTGNYQIYSTQQIDPEIIDRITVNLGTTDVDSPTASATGGTVNYSTRKPAEDFGALVRITGGSYNYKRVFGMVDTGVLGPWGTRAFVAASHYNYDKFRGEGELRRDQFNARVWQPVRENDFISVGFTYLKSRNHAYRSASAADYRVNGLGYDYNAAYVADAPTPGVADNDNAGSSSNPLNPAAGGNYYNLRINPTDQAMIRGQSLFHITDRLRLTIDPSFTYTLANGGTQSTTITETDRRLIGASNAAGVDLNGDGDRLDTVRVMNPSNTNTRRYGLTSSLIWDLNDNHRLRVAYTKDYGRHRQTGEYSTVDLTGDFPDWYGGKDGHGTKIRTADGSFLRRRDRFSIAQLDQFAADYRGSFLDERLVLNLGVKAQKFSRDLNQYCFYRGSQLFGEFQYCTTAPNDPNTVGARAPFKSTVEYENTSPNVGVSFKPFGDAHMFYASYAENISAPRTDDLYDIQVPNVTPEETKSYDIGYRLQTGAVTASAALWKTDYQNRIVRSFNEDLGISITRNLGSVELWGVDGEVAWQVTEALTLYGSAAYINSEVQNDTRITALTVLPTKGKQLVETPEWTLFGRADYDIGPLSFGVQAKWVDKRPATDVNDEYTKAYTVVDLDITYDVSGWGLPEGSALQLNVQNLLDEQYFGSISSGTNATAVVTPTGTVAPSLPFYQVGSPRTVQLSLQVAF
jgi:iron complex outermembrane recepter protein